MRYIGLHTSLQEKREGAAANIRSNEVIGHKEMTDKASEMAKKDEKILPYS